MCGWSSQQSPAEFTSLSTPSLPRDLLTRETSEPSQQPSLALIHKPFICSTMLVSWLAHPLDPESTTILTPVESFSQGGAAGGEGLRGNSKTKTTAALSVPESLQVSFPKNVCFLP